MPKRYANESKSVMTACGLEVRRPFEVRVDVLVEEARRGEEVLGERAALGHRVVDVADGEPLDLDDVREALREKSVRPPADDDLHLVPLAHEVLADDLAPRRVPHPFAGDAVEDAHRPSRGCRIAYVSFATLFSTFGTRLNRLIDGGRFSITRTGISLIRMPPRSARMTNSLAKTSFSTRHARTVSRSATPPERLEAVRVGAAEAEDDAEHPRVGDARGVAQEGPVVLGADRELRADDDVGLAGLEDLDRAPVEVGVAEVDLVADDELAARHRMPCFSALP